MAVKVKELKEDAVVDIKVNKTYYYMMKSALFYIFQNKPESKNNDEALKKIMSGKYEDMDEWDRTFHTITLFLAEVEKQARDKNLYDEKEILEPDDEGYIAPTQE
jgi:hypothetical protein